MKNFRLVVNPQYHKIDAEVRSTNGKLSRSLALFGALNIEEAIEPQTMEIFTQKKAALKDDIETLQARSLSSRPAEKRLITTLPHRSLIFLGGYDDWHQ